MRFKRVYIEITNICNLNCSFCSKINRAPYEMSAEEFEKIAFEIKKVTDYIFLHVKGEPLTHSQFDKILTICDKLEFKVNITTNGTLLKNNVQIINKHKSVRQINISLHSNENAKTLERYLNDVISSAETLSKNCYISYRVWTYDENNLTQKQIINKLSSYYNTQIDLKTNRCTLNNNVFFSVGDVFEWPSPLLSDYGEKGYCLGTRSQIAVLSNGEVVPCCLDAEGIVSFGNLNRQSIEEILSSERFLKMYNGLSERKITENLCRHCSYRLKFNNK